MRGRVADEARLKGLLDAPHADELHAARPESVGATLGITEDGPCVQTSAFTDEESARRGEQVQMPEDARRAMESAMHDVTYADLHHPWFASRA